MSDWWQFTQENHGDVSAEFSSMFTPLFNGVAKDGKVTCEAFASLAGKFNEFRKTKNHDTQDMPLEMFQGFWAKEGLAAGLDVLTAVRLAWMLCNDG